MFRNIRIDNKMTVYFISNFSPSTYKFYNQCILNINILQCELSSAISYPKYNSSKVSATRNTYASAIDYRIQQSTYLSILIMSLISGLTHRVQTLAVITVSCHFP